MLIKNVDYERILLQSRLLFQLDGSKMSPDYRVPPIVVYERKDSKWTLKDKHT